MLFSAVILGGEVGGVNPGERPWGTPRQILRYGFHKSLDT